MSTIHATFEDGVFKPHEKPDLPVHAEVRLTIEVLPPSSVHAGNLSSVLDALPKLGDDADDFAKDLRALRSEFPAEPGAWE